MQRPLRDQARSALRLGRRFVRNAVQRRMHPDKFIQNDQSPYEEVFRDGIVALRHYAAPTAETIEVEGMDPLAAQPARHRVPLLMVPPLGVHTWIFDLLQDRSLVRYFGARGFDVYLVDWGTPSAEDHDLGFDAYVNRWLTRAIAETRSHSGVREISMLGYCMGGLMCLMYLGANRDPDVRGLVTIASPVDFHGGPTYGRVISAVSVPAMAIHRVANFRLGHIDPQRFHMPGWLASLAFRATNPPGTLRAYLAMVRNLADTEYVTEYMSIGQWFSDMPDFPGAIIQEMAEKLAIANQLATGRLRIGDRLVDLRLVRCDLFAVAGDTDAIVDVAAARRVLKVVASSDKTFHIGPGGHAGVFAGSKAPAHVWKPIADWLAARSS